MFRPVTGNKPLCLTEMPFFKERNVNKYECISKADTHNRLSMGSSTSKLADKVDSASKANRIHIRILVSGNLPDTQGWRALNSVKLYCSFLLPSWEFYDEKHFLHINSVSSKSYILIEDIPWKFNMCKGLGVLRFLQEECCIQIVSELNPRSWCEW